MKVADYILLYNNSEDKALVMQEIAASFCTELNACMLRLGREDAIRLIGDKWRCFARKVVGVRAEGFDLLVKSLVEKLGGGV